MHDACGSCGLPFTREQGFYLGSISINYGVTVIVTGALYALLVAGLGMAAVTILFASGTSPRQHADEVDLR